MGASRRAGIWLLLACTLATTCGCAHFHQPEMFIPDVPSERKKTILADYMIESPDLLQIDLLYAVPKPPYKIQPLDVLSVTVRNTLENEPLTGLYPVEPDGLITFGGRYGNVKVSGMTLKEATEAIQKHLDPILKEPPLKVANVAVAEGRGVQLIRGQHLVRPDGTVSLGSYGTVIVAGHTLSEAKALIEAHLKQYLESAEIVINVIGYNSKVYYVIFDFGGNGQQVIRLPVTGNDTVLDAISQVNGLTSVSDARNVRVARSAGAGEPDQILPVDWEALTCRGRSETNYQLMPGDRIFVKAYPMTALDNRIARVVQPVERLFGFTLLGTATYKGVKFANTFGGSSTSGGGF